MDHLTAGDNRACVQHEVVQVKAALQMKGMNLMRWGVPVWTSSLLASGLPSIWAAVLQLLPRIHDMHTSDVLCEQCVYILRPINTRTRPLPSVHWPTSCWHSSNFHSRRVLTELSGYRQIFAGAFRLRIVDTGNSPRHHIDHLGARSADLVCRSFIEQERNSSAFFGAFEEQPCFPHLASAADQRDGWGGLYGNRFG